MESIKKTTARKVELEKWRVGLEIELAKVYKRANETASPLVYSGRRLRLALWRN